MKQNKPKKTSAFVDLTQAASMTECTGVLPVQIETDGEGESIAALQDIPPIKAPRDKAKR